MLDKTSFEVWLPNGKLLGKIEQDVDGYFHFLSTVQPKDGFIPAFILRELADRIDEINEPWDKIIEQHLARL
jgi:hypothetical protein